MDGKKLNIFMPKPKPPQSPDYCVALNQASYAQDMQEANTLLQSRYPDAKIVAEQSFKQWKVCLVKQGDQLSAVFRVQTTHLTG